MHTKQAIRTLIESCDMVVRAYIGDLSDADLLVRSVPRANHIAWQLGHMIAGTAEMLGQLGHSGLTLPAGFAEGYTSETSAVDDPARFAAKAQYAALLDQAKAAILAAIDATPDDALDLPGPESMREYAPTIAAALMVQGTHWLMHAGQFVPIRRKLGRPPLF
jgi:hypothetical protein